MTLEYDEIMDTYIVGFNYYNRGCLAYFDTKEEAQMWIDYVQSKEK
jgi:hypothetical protein